ncbi:ABC transporter ATP-binding protein [Salinibacterium sp. G-O1]|uniref:ABC transporter ATP-binding protein n=1 Tax=Salinibacterium sp. G-O1 TaxID=3046208 RepID=UPI0024BB9262|nr:ABC transporter ATP-binding protein [Salinibacterium sp. G-O1]MDJ0335527.1 ABC transporter ATP-binding protein [Salinibacterium sp. G-O1]
MSDAIAATALSKAFGSKLALDNVDLTVDEGSIFGFLGPNGAGKTTMLRLLTGLARPTSGSVRVLGHDVTSAGNSVRAEIGFLPDVPAFYDWMTAEQFLDFAGGLFGLRGAAQRDRIEMLLDLSGLGGVTARIGDYSRGMKQRLGIAQALINAPRLLLLDEPTSALDPIGRKEVLDMVASLRGRTTVFFSTHILGDVERVCDTVAILDRGRIVAHAPIDDLKRQYGQHKIVIQVTEGAQMLAAAIATCAWAASAAQGSHDTIEVAVSDIEAARREIPALVASQGTGLVRMEAGEMGLEEVFVELVGGARS